MPDGQSFVAKTFVQKNFNRLCTILLVANEELSFDLKLTISGFEIKLLVFCNTEVMNIFNTEAKLSLANTRDN